MGVLWVSIDRVRLWEGIGLVGCVGVKSRGPVVVVWVPWCLWRYGRIWGTNIPAPRVLRNA